MSAMTLGTKIAQRAISIRQRRLAPRAVFYDIAAHFTPALAVDSDGLRYWVSTHDRFVGRETFISGGFDDDALQRILRELKRASPSFVLKDRTLLEIGANIGTTTIPLLRRHGAANAIVFEPAPDNLRLLRLNCVDNGIEGRVTVHAAALSDRDGDIGFALAPGNPGDHRVMVGDDWVPGAFDEATRQTLTVPAYRLDTLVESGAVKLDDLGLVWMDAQGHEGQILDGARKLLGRDIPIVTEFWPYGLRRQGGLETLCALLVEHYEFVIEMGMPGDDTSVARAVPTSELASLERRYDGESFTDLLLVPEFARTS